MFAVERIKNKKGLWLLTFQIFYQLQFLSWLPLSDNDVSETLLNGFGIKYNIAAFRSYCWGPVYLWQFLKPATIRVTLAMHELVN